ncbi:hypothetical protein FA95DRAFT_1613506 [Auriscalpium vulgare]|uniref:Uncharacterized protein n=1 Tax=Auriscalpium vulgare TaxID=40419 RepID=A0ACB8R3F9_9AGAM|nr:hypothetical protein FA95DRAFT_1613506 [Auriscalpium vulgare]
MTLPVPFLPGIDSILIRPEYFEAADATLNFSEHVMKPPSKPVADVDDETALEEPFKSPSWTALKKLFERVKTTDSVRSGFILTGHPGIGKTLCLYFLLCLRLLAGRPTLFQHTADCVFRYRSTGVTQINFSDHPSLYNLPDGTWILVDSNRQVKDVHKCLMESKGFIVQASLPRVERMKWRSKGCVSTFIMRPWSLAELIVGQTCIEGQLRSSEAEIESFGRKYQPSARLVYTQSRRASAYEEELVTAVACLTLTILQDVIRSTRGLHFPEEDNVSHRILLVKPGATRGVAAASVPTAHLVRTVMDRLPLQQSEDRDQLYKLCLSDWHIRAAAQTAFAHDMLSQGGVWEVWPMTRDLSQTLCHWRSDPSDRLAENASYLRLGDRDDRQYVDIQKSTKRPSRGNIAPFSVTIYPSDYNRDLVGERTYSRLQSSSAAMFDSFMYDRSSETATVFEVTDRNPHDVKAQGLRWLRGHGVKRFRYIAITTHGTPVDFIVQPDEAEKDPINIDAMTTEVWVLSVKSLKQE